MKVFSLFSFLSLLLILASCGEKENREVEMDDTMATQQEYQDPEEAFENWTDAWNSNDPQQLQALAASDAVLVLNGEEVPADSIQGFFQNVGPVMKDLQINSLKKGSTENLAYNTGTYSHTYSTDTTQQYQGTYTFVWERTNDENEWKVKAMNISSLRPEEN